MQNLGFALSPILKVRVVQTSSEMASDVDEANGTLRLVTRSSVSQEARLNSIVERILVFKR